MPTTGRRGPSIDEGRERRSLRRPRRCLRKGGPESLSCRAGPGRGQPSPTSTQGTESGNCCLQGTTNRFTEVLTGDGPEGSKAPSGCRQRAALACQLPPKNQGGPQGSLPLRRSPRISSQRAPLPSSSLGNELFTKRSEPSGSFSTEEFLDGALLGVSVLPATSLLSPLRP